MKARSPNIVLFGETGYGKSSVVNLIAGKEIAQTSPDIDGCTKTCKRYPLTANGVSYTTWDTASLDEPVIGRTGRLHAVDRGRITTITQKNYALVYEVACRKAVPIAIVVTHLEQEGRMEDWWDQNAEAFERRGMMFCGYACVTALLGDPKVQESSDAIKRLLNSHDSNGRYRMPSRAEELVESEWKGKDLVRILRERCGLREHDAHRVALILDN